jgi:hypothetical protein
MGEGGGEPRLTLIEAIERWTDPALVQAVKDAEWTCPVFVERH